MRDDAVIGPVTYRRVPVRIFDTSMAEPTDLYSVGVGGYPELDQYVGVTAQREPSAGETGRLFLHTSAGLRRFEIAGAAAKPAGPSEGVLAAYELNCRKFQEEFAPGIELKWLIDPPWERDMLRQWLLVFKELPAGARVTVQGKRGEEELGTLAEVRAEQAGAATIELVTDATTELSVNHTLDGVPAVRIAQRWLTPLQRIDVPAGTNELLRDGSGVAVLGGDLAVSSPDVADRVGRHAVAGERVQSSRQKTSTADGASRRGSTFSTSLPSGCIAALWEGQLVIAVASSPVVEETPLAKSEGIHG